MYKHAICKNITMKDLRKHIGFVSQETFLFDGTIGENIAYYDSSATLDNIIQASKKSQADEFINNLPDRYDTLIGERGQKLSAHIRYKQNNPHFLDSQAFADSHHFDFISSM